MKYLIKNKHWEINKEYNKEKLLYLLIDRPDDIKYNGKVFVWLNNKNQFHRKYDLPSYVWHNDIIWHKQNKRHRGNGKPAYIHFDGYQEYWLDGKCIKTKHLK